MSKTKADVNKRILADAIKNYLENKSSVETTRIKQTRMKEFLRPLPPINVPHKDMPLAVLNPASIEQWENYLQENSPVFDDSFSTNRSDEYTII